MEISSLVTVASDFKKVRAANQTGNTFAAVPDSLTKPVGAGYIDLTNGGLRQGLANNLLFKFYGVGADTQTGKVRIYGVRRVFDNSVSPAVVSYTHVLLFDGTFTITSGATGVASGVVGASELYADTIALVGTGGVENVTFRIISPGSDMPATLLIDPTGCPDLFVDVIRDTVATSVNALMAEV